MAEQLWRRCPNPCPECGGSHFIPLPSSALVIGDGFDSAVTRGRKFLAARGEITALEMPALVRAILGEG